MRSIVADVKLLCAGIGLGALTCAALVGNPADHICGTVALVAAMATVTCRFVEARV